MNCKISWETSSRYFKINITNRWLRLKKTTAEADAAFEHGRNIAYYDVLGLISTQLSAFGYKFPQARLIVPELGKPL